VAHFGNKAKVITKKATVTAELTRQRSITIAVVMDYGHACPIDLPTAPTA